MRKRVARKVFKRRYVLDYQYLTMRRALCALGLRVGDLCGYLRWYRMGTHAGALRRMRRSRRELIKAVVTTQLFAAASLVPRG